MSLARWGQMLRLGAELPAFLGGSVTPEAARRSLQQRLQRRDELFLDVARRGIYDNPRSPYRSLLRHAGCTYADLSRAVRCNGLEKTLEELRDAGVAVTFDELKGTVPIARPDLCLRATDFDNPLSGPGLITGRTSGTRARPVRVAYDWPFIAEEAENESVLYACHGVGDAPIALWYPLRAGIAGIHNLLMDLKRRRPPEKWFTQTRGKSAREWMMISCVALLARREGMRVPSPEIVPLDDAAQVAVWMSEARRRCGRAVVRTFTSSAVRAAREARTQGIDLGGCVMFVGGEPLTRDRHREISASGARAVARYVSTETGLIGAACGAAPRGDEMHVYTDRLAVIPGAEVTDGRRSLLMTTLLPSASKIFLNTDVGDVGDLRRGPCTCDLGQLGMDLHVSSVGSVDRFTAEGVAIPIDVMDGIVGGVLRSRGGATDDYQFWEVGERADLVIVVDPRVPGIEEEAFRAEVLEGLRQGGAPHRVAADLWGQAGLPRLRRGPPKTTAGQKTPRLVRGPS